MDNWFRCKGEKRWANNKKRRANYAMEDNVGGINWHDG